MASEFDNQPAANGLPGITHDNQRPQEANHPLGQLAAMSTVGTQDSRLLSLPAELRNRIYRLAVVEEAEIIISITGHCSYPPLLASCRQIRREAIGIYFSLNTFRAIVSEGQSHGPVAWIARADHKAITYIEKLTLECRADSFADDHLNAFVRASLARDRPEILRLVQDAFYPQMEPFYIMLERLMARGFKVDSLAFDIVLPEWPVEISASGWLTMALRRGRLVFWAEEMNSHRASMMS